MIERCPHCPVAPWRICWADDRTCEAIRLDTDKRSLFKRLQETIAPEVEQPRPAPTIPTIPLAITKQAMSLGYRHCLYASKTSASCGCVHCHHLDRKITLHACLDCLGLTPAQ